MFFNSFCCYFWYWGGSTWVLLGKSSSNLKFKHGWSCFLTVYVIIFDFEVGVPGCYLVNLCQISSLSMADHVFYSFCCYFWFWGGSTWVYQVNLSQIWSLSMADHVFNSFCCYFWFWGGSTWVVLGKSL